MYIYIYISVCIFIYTHICMYIIRVCVYINIHIMYLGHRGWSSAGPRTSPCKCKGYLGKYALTKAVGPANCGAANSVANRMFTPTSKYVTKYDHSISCVMS